MQQKSFAQGLRNPRYAKRFEGENGEALAACRKWLADRMFASGPEGNRGDFIGVMYGVETVGKLRDLDSEERADLHGHIFPHSGDFRRGAVTVMLRPDAPESVLSAFRAEIPDPVDTMSPPALGEGAPA